MKRKMKEMKFIKKTGLAMAAIFAGVCILCNSASAGSNDVILDNSSFAEKLNTSKWNNPDEDVQIKDNKIVFSKKSTADTRIITQTAMKVSEQNEKIFSGTCTMTLKEIPKDKRFILALGLQNMESFCEEAGSVELSFTDNGGLKLAVLSYDESGERKVLLKERTCGITMGKAFEVEITIKADMQLQIAIDGQTMYDAKSPVNLEGRVGFLQTGSCQAEISDMDMRIYRYETPENCNVEEDFEKNTINVNTLTSKMINTCNYHPAGVHVEDYNGNKVLMFRNVGCGYIGTMYRYSNFEMTFDIPYMLHNGVLREDGSIQTPASLGFALAYGGDSQDYDFFGFESAADALVFSSTDVYSYKYSSGKVSFADQNLYDKDTTQGFTVRLTVEDAVLTLEMKALEATEYKKILSYEIGETTPTGYIHIWSTGQANFAIDNLSIINKDVGANLVEVEYKSGLIEKQPDWEYQPVEAPYLVEDTTKDGGVNQYLPLIGAAVVGVCMIGCSLIAVKVRKMRKKEGPEDEA